MFNHAPFCRCDGNPPPATLRQRIRIYLLGMREYRTDWTAHFDYPEIETYDAGRDMAHRLTFRRFDPSFAFGKRPRL